MLLKSSWQSVDAGEYPYLILEYFEKENGEDSYGKTEVYTTSFQTSIIFAEVTGI